MLFIVDLYVEAREWQVLYLVALYLSTMDIAREYDRNKIALTYPNSSVCTLDYIKQSFEMNGRIFLQINLCIAVRLRNHCVQSKGFCRFMVHSFVKGNSTS